MMYSILVLQNGVKIIEVCVGETNSAQIYHNHYSKHIIENLKKHFHHKLQESYPDFWFVILERRRANSNEIV